MGSTVMSTVIFSISFILLYPYFCLAHGFLFLLNGTSSAGKSSIACELKKQLKARNITAVITGEDYMNDYDVKVQKNNDAIKTTQKKKIITAQEVDHRQQSKTLANLSQWGSDWHTTSRDYMYKCVKKWLASNKCVIIEDILYHAGEVEQHINQCGNPLHMNSLIYCSPKTLIQHIDARNRSQNKDDHRSHLKSLYQFLVMYKLLEDKGKEPLFIDPINTLHYKDLIKGYIEYKDTSSLSKDDMHHVGGLLELHNQKCAQLTGDTIKVVPEDFIPYDIIIKTDDDDPAACAKKILDQAQKYAADFFSVA